MTTCAYQVVWLRRVLGDLREKQVAATEIYCDSILAVMLARNPVFHSRTKHIEIKHHYIRELMTNGHVKLKGCGTED